MSDEDGHAWKFGLIFIICGICSVLTMGIYSANHPHTPLTQGRSHNNTHNVNSGLTPHIPCFFIFKFAPNNIINIHHELYIHIQYILHKHPLVIRRFILIILIHIFHKGLSTYRHPIIQIHIYNKTGLHII